MKKLSLSVVAAYCILGCTNQLFAEPLEEKIQTRISSLTIEIQEREKKVRTIEAYLEQYGAKDENELSQKLADEKNKEAILQALNPPRFVHLGLIELKQEELDAWKNAQQNGVTLEEKVAEIEMKYSFKALAMY